MEVDGDELALGVKRLTYEEATKLRAKWRAAENAPEGEKTDAWGALLLEAFRRYLRLECEVEIDFGDGKKEMLRKAEELLELFGGRTGILNEIFFSIILQNSLTEEQKKLFRSGSASSPSSEEPEKEAPGPTPETTAGSAESGASAGSGAATNQAETPSGSTDPATTPSSSTNAPSVH